MIAMRALFPWLDRTQAWRERYEATLREVSPSPEEFEELRREAARLINEAGKGYDPARRYRPRRERKRLREMA
jgi:hypothetical protein